MKLGIFDSGLGGLIITKSVRHALPDIDIVYLGDTLHLPYGNRSDNAIYEYTKRCMIALFEQQECQLIVIACNTASAAALRRLQQQWLPKNYPDRNIIGVVVPTLEEAIERGHKKIGLIGTNYIVHSGVYEEELRKIDPQIELVSVATPLLVPLIEHEGKRWLEEVLQSYIGKMVEDGIQCLILGCTHYAALKPHLKKTEGNIDIISQDDIIPSKLMRYLQKHPEHDNKITKNGKTSFFVTDLTQNYLNAAENLYGSALNIKKTEV